MQQQTIERNLGRIANQVLKGIKNDNSVLKSKDNFIKKYGSTLELIVPSLPKQTPIAAALCKAAIKDGAMNIASFCNRFNKQLFDGVLDPAHQLWEQINKKNKPSGVDLYKLAIAAIKMNKNGKPYKRLRPSETDLFEFDDNLEIIKKAKPK